MLWNHLRVWTPFLLFYVEMKVNIVSVGPHLPPGFKCDRLWMTYTEMVNRALVKSSALYREPGAFGTWTTIARLRRLEFLLGAEYLTSPKSYHSPQTCQVSKNLVLRVNMHKSSLHFQLHIPAVLNRTEQSRKCWTFFTEITKYYDRQFVFCDFSVRVQVALRQIRV